MKTAQLSILTPNIGGPREWKICLLIVNKYGPKLGEECVEADNGNYKDEENLSAKKRGNWSGRVPEKQKLVRKKTIIKL